MYFFAGISEYFSRKFLDITLDTKLFFSWGHFFLRPNCSISLFHFLLLIFLLFFLYKLNSQGNHFSHMTSSGTEPINISALLYVIIKLSKMTSFNFFSFIQSETDTLLFSLIHFFLSFNVYHITLHHLHFPDDLLSLVSLNYAPIFLH